MHRVRVQKVRSRKVFQNHKPAFNQAQPVQCLGDQFLSGTSLACDQRGAVVRRDTLNAGKHLPHFWTPSHDALKLGGFHYPVFSVPDLLSYQGSINDPAHAIAKRGQ
jgi:hypothetical protein